MALATANIAHVLLSSGVDRPRGLLIALSILTTAPLAWRRTSPLASALVFAVFFAVLLSGDYPDFLVGTLAGAVIVPYSVGAHVDSLPLSATPLALMLAAGWYDDIRLDHPAGQFVAGAFLQGVPWVLARVVRAQRTQAERLERLTRELEARRDQATHAALTEERNRIARELHDLVAHAISVIAVQSAGAEAALGERSEAARTPLKLIQRTSREALMEMRRMLQVLRGPTASGGHPQRGIEDLPKLIEDVQAAGTDVRLDFDGEEEVPRTVGMNAYRIVQECLTNVRKHAGATASAHVVVDRKPDRLRILVRDDGVGMRDEGNAGHGLLGIRERARLFGGTMTAGDGAGGGFAVEVEIPTSGDGG